jgi:sporulation protein YlmC with PRC-barrel domain
MKTTILAASLTALLASGALAQTTPSPATPGSQPPARTQTKVAPTQEAKGAWHAKDFMRSNVYNMSGDKIGDVNDIVIDESGKVTGIVVGVGGFLGLGEKEVELSLDKVKRMVHSDGKTYFTANATKEELQSAPAYARPKT